MTKLIYTDGQKSIEFDLTDPEQKAALDGFSKELSIDMDSQIVTVQKELGVTYACACDVWYLRGHSRHTLDLEARVIASHKAGNPLNIMELDNVHSHSSF